MKTNIWQWIMNVEKAVRRMTEQEAIKYLEQHAYIDDAVKDMCIKAMKKQISKEISVAPIKAHAEPTKIRTVIQTDKETTFDDVQEILNGTDLLAKHFRVNDIFYIPVKNQEEAIPFEIVHIKEDDRVIYLMSKDILAKKPIKNDEAREWLDKFGWSLPDDIFKHLKPIEHINRNGRYSSLVAMPSIMNMGKDEAQCTGADDIKFDKFRDEASRCKNYKGETNWQWTDTPYASSSTLFWLVYTNGYCSHNGNATNAYGICPLIKLSKDEQKKEQEEK